MNNQSLKQFFAQNLKLIFGFLVIVAVAAGGTALWKEKKQSKEREASNALYETRKMSDPLVQARDYKNAISLLDAFTQKYPGTRAAFESNLQIADLYVDGREPVKAIDFYSRAEKGAPDDFSKILAIYSRGIAEEIAGRHEEAVKSLDQALKAGNSEFMRPEILMAQARNYEALKDYAKAMEIYKTVQDKYASKTYYSSAAAAFQGKLSTNTVKQ